MLERALVRARWTTFWERLWPPFAAIATAIGLFLAVSWLGLWLWLPPLGRAVALFAFHADSPRGPWTAHALNPVVCDVSCARPAGQPFVVDGVWYRPSIDYGYDATGTAVVYDSGASGEVTANGEIYQTDALTAAHKTLPLPSNVALLPRWMS